jgi:hypothetical protein
MKNNVAAAFAGTHATCALVAIFSCAFMHGEIAHAEEPPAVEEKKAIEKIVHSYFELWSTGKIDEYGDLFAETAAIQYLSDGNELTTLGLVPFLHEQRQLQVDPRSRSKEAPVNIEIKFGSRLARAKVFYKLTFAEETSYGYDHFTFAKVEGDWRIVHLLYYDAPPPKAQ